MKSNEMVYKNRNLGIEILRFILCFWIVFNHCSIIKKEHFKYLTRSFHVPTFILLSFFFYFHIISRRNIPKIISRFQRLLIPYILWPIIVLLINNFLISKFSLGQFQTKLTMKDFIIQILIGAKYHLIFWFQFNLLLSSLFFTIISFAFKKQLLKLLKLFGVVSVYLIISGLNYTFFLNCFRSYKRIFLLNFASLIELMPVAIIGCIFSSINLLSKIKHFSINFFLFLIYTIIILFQFDLFIIKPGFRYPNVLLDIFGSINLFLLFGSLSFEKIKNEKYIHIIRNITQFTGGIYYIHGIFRDYLRKYTNFFAKCSYLSSVCIYIICYIFCFVGNKIFTNYKIKYLFI